MRYANIKSLVLHRGFALGLLVTAACSKKNDPAVEVRTDPQATATESGTVRGPDSVQRASSDQAHALVQGGATLLDVRTPAEFAEGHIDGATNIPVDELGSRASEVVQGRPVVVYCRSGKRSARAATLLAAQGYEVHDLGAMSAWAP